MEIVIYVGKRLSATIPNEKTSLLVCPGIYSLIFRKDLHFLISWIIAQNFSLCTDRLSFTKLCILIQLSGGSQFFISNELSGSAEAAATYKA